MSEPPSPVCLEARRIFGVSVSAEDLRDLADTDPLRFDLFLFHAERHPVCKAMINSAFPTGFVSQEEATALNDRIAAIAQELEAGRDLDEILADFDNRDPA